ncbi:MAG: acyl-CoA--6-aminopenicillanic acid acyl-transferase [Flavobacteriaceae bacterium]|uniref:C45 family autoproteolytic acyltransferase/hydolase n=1 Tax=Leeuwenhoekiella sp. UBA1003 TaxID=1946744 RepID=UPI000C910512|nr:C45 family autoproteolytic acyltransferase/hydolase [Leeuwenhoekiella sp. UBA1003]MAT90031.1 acyl-CoA--6-aminopenicillanic acid acyl-transferase [Flavobacteriaceae bacterium]
MPKRLQSMVCLFWMTLVLVSCGIRPSINDRPSLEAYNSEAPVVIEVNDSTRLSGNNFLVKNQYGLWELYVEGDPLERGLATGSLTEALIQKQEAAFFGKVKELVPSEGQQKFLKKFLAWYNRKMYQHIPNEYKAEIYGVSQFAASTYDDIAPPYLRSLYLHGAHDIGHALQDLALVGCSAFAVWGDKTEDGQLLIGRNFDFYAGDEFAEEKIIAFVNPDNGHGFMSVTWGGMVGVVSGMNTEGLTVTINAGKSKVPLTAKTPISIVARDILQYASTISEAEAIAKKYEVFVSEAIFVGSATEKRAAIIEVSPNNFGVYEVANTSQLICSNHFQSDAFSEDKRNLKTIEESHSAYRFERMEELISEEKKIAVSEAVSILRNRKGLDDVILGNGNEKALNQLLAHHGIVFKPEERQVWISTNPYQLGAFVAYDLDEVFSGRDQNPPIFSVSLPSKLVPADPFLKTEEYQNYEAYRLVERRVEAALEADVLVSATILQQLTTLNPKYWKAFFLAGTYYYEQQMYAEAQKHFQRAITLIIPSVPEREEVLKYLRKTKRKLS